MTNKTTQTPLSTTIGALFITTLATSPIVNAESNPFAAQQLPGGYMVADTMAEGKCGGDKAMKTGEGKCGGDKAMKTGEGKCGGDKAMKTMEGKCGGDKAMKTGEGKCGSKK